MWAAIAKALISVALTYAISLLQPAPEVPAGSLEDLGRATTKPGRVLSHGHGRFLVSNPQLVWKGDFRRQALSSSALFGLVKSSAGYVYRVGLWYVLTRHADSITEILVDRRPVWSGVAADEQIRAQSESHFGGWKQGGGFDAFTDVMMGGSSQAINDYIAAHVDNATGTRRRVALVMRRANIGETARLHSLAVACRNFYDRADGATQWYPETVEIETGPEPEHQVEETLVPTYDGATNTDVAVPDPWDEGVWRVRSGDSGHTMIEPPADVSAWPNLGATGFADDYFLRVHTGSVGSKYGVVLYRDLAALAGAAYELEARLTVDIGRSTHGGVQIHGASASIITAATIAGVTNPSGETTEATVSIGPSGGTDWTPLDTGWVTLSADQAAVGIAMSGTVGHVFRNMRLQFRGKGQSIGSDKNPAHILDELREDDRDEASFTAAADLFFAEGLGISPHWTDPISRSDAVRQIEEICDCMLYRDRETGKAGIAVHRSQYGDPSSLPRFDRANVRKWGKPAVPARYNLPTHLNLVYTDWVTKNTASVPLVNGAAQARRGRMIPETREYPAITADAVAEMVGARLLRAASYGPRTGYFEIDFLPREYHRGSYIVLDNPLLGMNELVAIIQRIKDPSPAEPWTTVWYYEAPDLSSEALVSISRPTPSPLVSAPADADPRFVEEMPYQALVDALGRSAVDAALAASTGMGYLHATAAAPSSDAGGADLWTDAGAGYAERGGGTEFCPVFTLAADLASDPSETTVSVSETDLDDLAEGQILALGDEYLEVVSVSEGSGGGQITVLRGMYDTVPQAHAAGAAIFAWRGFAYSSGVEHADATVVDVKMLTRTPLGVLELAAASAETVIFDSRAARPYRPGHLQLEGAYRPGSINDGDSLTWASRNRRTEALAAPRAYADASEDAAESGASWRLEVIGLDEVDGTELASPHFTDASAASPYTMLAADYLGGLPSAAAAIRIKVWGVRDGLDSWQAASVDASLTGALLKEDGDFLLQEDGGRILLE